jgi:hypothetical protein
VAQIVSVLCTGASCHKYTYFTIEVTYSAMLYICVGANAVRDVRAQYFQSRKCWGLSIMSINADVDGYVAEDPRDSLDDGAT